ncbi:RagB/SusD family nutrient uptake outer membrane protein [Pseudoflavitalea sp. G-6-1-2]|uniref:RagB/SusD family nutrient uptake outer membrane protein n=1 Tax=Pseudoflavitalea sp. G-6-1-2 TaxID=2728841 RepID=UPI00146A15D4|nr:RagB/SusD family nutrient uptake outer membrane protein [Pseudoflavitalea sp. G-6-1-2]NML19246.1 RagB/SusD family nutrient uptake outer membrane protein [Pseudoflavitalea sp. G-6-1-2]
MKRHRIYKGLLALTIAASLTSCKKDFIELNPPTSVDPAVALRSEADARNAMSGAYAGLRGVGFYGRALMIYGDLLGDNIYQHVNNSNRYTAFNNLNYTVANADILSTWTQGYNVILRANNIINCALPSSPTMDQIRGEALAVRALSYFSLVRYYARPYTDNPANPGVPLVVKYDAFAKPGRATVEEVYTQIVTDLNTAFTLMTAPNTNSPASAKNSSQFTKYGAKALLAKVYLTMGKMPEALVAAKDVIDNSGYKTLSASDIVGYWSNSSFRTDLTETLFEVSADAVSNNSFDGLSYIYSQNGNYGDFVVNDAFYAIFSANDARRQLMPVVARPKPNGVAVPTVDKFPVIQGDVSDTKVLRMSEMYLIAAEASVGVDDIQAQTYVNYITSRRNADPILSTGAALLEDILTERRKELAFEGDRFMDLQRLKRNIDRGANFPTSVRNIPYSNFRRLFPIPQTELDANPTLRPQQNPDWN